MILVPNFSSQKAKSGMIIWAMRELADAVDDSIHPRNLVFKLKSFPGTNTASWELSLSPWTSEPETFAMNVI